MSLKTMDNLLWATGFVGHVALLFVLLWKRRFRTFPIFTSLIAYQAAVTIILFFIYRQGSLHMYYDAYWALAPVDYVLQVALIFEMARIVLRPTGTWVQDARTSFLIWAAIGMVIAAGLSLAVTPPAVTGLDLWLIRVTVFTSLLTCEVFLAMSAAANRLGLLWGNHVMALGEGLTIWALSALISNLAHFAFGWNRNYVIFDHIKMCVYLGSLAFWMVAFWRPERQREPLSEEMQNYLVTLHQRVYDLDSVKSTGRPNP